LSTDFIGWGQSQLSYSSSSSCSSSISSHRHCRSSLRRRGWRHHHLLPTRPYEPKYVTSWPKQHTRILALTCGCTLAGFHQRLLNQNWRFVT
jgi:hypothetical protein